MVPTTGSPQSQFVLNVDGNVTDISETKHHVQLDSTGSTAWDVSRSYNFTMTRGSTVQTSLTGL